MSCKWYKFQFHKWEKIYKPFKTTIEDMEYTKYYDEYRMCKKCGVVERLGYDFESSFWSKLDKCAAKIIKDKIKKKKLFKKEDIEEC